MNDNLQRLVGNGLSLTWPIVIFGWRQGHMTREEVLSHAMDQIGYSAPNHADLVAELAFADPTDWWTIDRLASQLGEHDDHMMVLAARVWRWAAVADTVRGYSAAIDRFDAAGGTDGAWLDELSMDRWDLYQVWLEHEELCGEGPKVGEWDLEAVNTTDDRPFASYVAALRHFVAKHERWLDEEKTILQIDLQ